MFVKRAPASEQMSLQITSMADVFVILLVFLLKTYATGLMDVQVSQSTELPKADGADAAVTALQIEVSRDAYAIGGKPVASLKDLGSALEAEHARQKQPDSRLVVVADERVPYSTVKGVLAAAAERGFTDFKLAVVQR